MGDCQTVGRVSCTDGWKTVRLLAECLVQTGGRLSDCWPSVLYRRVEDCQTVGRVSCTDGWETVRLLAVCLVQTGGRLSDCWPCVLYRRVEDCQTVGRVSCTDGWETVSDCWPCVLYRRVEDCVRLLAVCLVQTGGRLCQTVGRVSCTDGWKTVRILAVPLDGSVKLQWPCLQRGKDTCESGEVGGGRAGRGGGGGVGGGGAREGFVLFVGCLMSQQHASVSQ